MQAWAEEGVFNSLNDPRHHPGSRESGVLAAGADSGLRPADAGSGLLCCATAARVLSGEAASATGCAPPCGAAFAACRTAAAYLRRQRGRGHALAGQ